MKTKKHDKIRQVFVFIGYIMLDIVFLRSVNSSAAPSTYFGYARLVFDRLIWLDFVWSAGFDARPVAAAVLIALRGALIAVWLFRQCNLRVQLTARPRLVLQHGRARSRSSTPVKYRLLSSSSDFPRSSMIDMTLRWLALSTDFREHWGCLKSTDSCLL